MLCRPPYVARQPHRSAGSWRVFTLSPTAFNPPTAYAEHRIRGATLVIFVALNALLTLVACYFMLGTNTERAK